jgi:FkbM family methyltransferase
MDLRLVSVNNGKYNVFVIHNDRYITPVLANGREWDGWMREDVNRHYKTGTDILDIGANIGYNSLIFSEFGPVHAWEPLFGEVSRQNALCNTLKNSVTVHDYALSDTTGESDMHIPKPDAEFLKRDLTIINYGNSGFDIPEETRSGVSIPVQKKRLDDVYSGTPSFIKLDVEGHEVNVLKGAVDIITKHKPAIIVEIHDMDNSEVDPFLREHGYETPIERPEHMYLYLHTSASEK